MNTVYAICGNLCDSENVIKTGYLATDRASGGYSYFSDSINNSEIRTFKSVEEARKFIETDLKRCEDGWAPTARWLHDVEGLRICEITTITRYFYILCNE